LSPIEAAHDRPRLRNLPEIPAREPDHEVTEQGSDGMILEGLDVIGSRKLAPIR
jgi:hypothetical protein